MSAVSACRNSRLANAWRMLLPTKPSLTSLWQSGRRRLSHIDAHARAYGNHDPAIYSASAKTARVLSTLDSERRMSALKQLQGALSLVEKLHRAKAISNVDGESSVSALVTLPLTDGRYQGRVVSWIREVLAPSLKFDQNVSERELIARMAGANTEAVLQQVKWEGESYRIDVARPEIERVIQIRQQQGQRSLETALKLEQMPGLCNHRRSPSTTRASCPTNCPHFLKCLYPRSSHKASFPAGSIGSTIRGRTSQP